MTSSSTKPLAFTDESDQVRTILTFTSESRQHDLNVVFSIGLAGAAFKPRLMSRPTFSLPAKITCCRTPRCSHTPACRRRQRAGREGLDERGASAFQQHLVGDHRVFSRSMPGSLITHFQVSTSSVLKPFYAAFCCLNSHQNAILIVRPHWSQNPAGRPVACRSGRA